MKYTQGLLGLLILIFSVTSFGAVTVRYNWSDDTDYVYDFTSETTSTTSDMNSVSETSGDITRSVQSYNHSRYAWEVTTSVSNFTTTQTQDGTEAETSMSGNILREKLDSRGFSPLNGIESLGDFGDTMTSSSGDDDDIKPFLSGLFLTQLPSDSMSVNDTFTVNHEMEPDTMTNSPTINIQWKLLSENETRLGRSCVKFAITSPNSTFSNWSGRPDTETPGEIDDMDVTTFDLSGTLWFDNSAGIIVEWLADVEIEGNSTLDPDESGVSNKTVSFSQVTSVNYKLTAVQ